jgi:hypothetical protein
MVLQCCAKVRKLRKECKYRPIFRMAEHAREVNFGLAEISLRPRQSAMFTLDQIGATKIWCQFLPRQTGRSRSSKRGVTPPLNGAELLRGLSRMWRSTCSCQQHMTFRKSRMRQIDRSNSTIWKVLGKLSPPSIRKNTLMDFSKSFLDFEGEGSSWLLFVVVQH